MRFDWGFWIPFNEDFAPDGGGAAINVTAETLDEAIEHANVLSVHTVEMLDMDGDTVGIHFVTATPFGRHNLSEIGLHMDSPGVSRLFGEGDEDFLKRVDAFIEECRKEGEDA